MSTVAESEVKNVSDLLQAQQRHVISAKEAEKAPFDMPSIAVGDDIEWYKDASRNNRPGLGKVLAVYPRTIDIILMDMGMGIMPRMAIRHINDPRLLNPTIRQESGGWDYAAVTKERMALKQRVTELEKFVTDLQAPSPAKKKESSNS